MNVITSDRDRWIEAMLTDEMGLSLPKRSPIKAATATMSAFLIAGLIPLLSFVVLAGFSGGERLPRISSARC